jgi:hypothetical protein
VARTIVEQALSGDAGLLSRALIEIGELEEREVYEAPGSPGSPARPADQASQPTSEPSSDIERSEPI